LDLGKKEEDECVDMGKQRGVNDGVAYSLDEWASKRPSNKNGPDANIVDFKKIY
jgi:hypothetical protein